MEKTKPKKSRSGSQTRQKLRMVTTAYDEDDFRKLDEAASRAGLTRASFQRVQSLSAPKTRSTRRPPIERAMLAKLLGQLGKVGSNLNQIAHAAHIDRAERGAASAVITELRALLPHILQAMGRKK